MLMKLPGEFLNKMKSLLDNKEYDEFIESYEQPRYYGLRVNTLKISVEGFLKITPFNLEPIPWTRDGFYYPEGENPGRHPYYNAGLYYIQEPSAMLPGEVIDAKPGEYILDLCAAPGGKTVQIAAGLKGKGLLVANDINADRVKALVKNIELCGVKNAVVLNETPEKLVLKFEGFFDKILVDAPCSGEGMFRKDEEAARSWERYKCEKCESMQWDIMQNVDRMLKPGGCIVYSTCTFSPEEDERMISRFLDLHDNYEILEIPKVAGIESGRPEWSDGNAGLAKTARLWPHRVKGEGHFVALLRKKSIGDTAMFEPSTLNFQHSTKNGDGWHEALSTFISKNLNISIAGHFEAKGSNIYNLPVPFPDLNGLKVAKFGWYLGEYVNGRFDPSHSLVVSLKRNELKKTIDFSAESREASSYLKGETVMAEGDSGLVAVCIDGYTAGWAKQSGDMLKNLYPKGWRKMR
jgi:NOL1/NOP2/sun family putative RNA methylase